MRVIALIDDPPVVQRILAPSGCHCAGPETHCLGQRALRVGDPTRTQCPLHGPRLLAEPRCAPASGRTRRMSRIDLPIGFWQGVETIPGIESQIPLEWLLKQVELALTEEEKKRDPGARRLGEADGDP